MPAGSFSRRVERNVEQFTWPPTELHYQYEPSEYFESVEDIFGAYDHDGDGYISFSEYAIAWSPYTDITSDPDLVENFNQLVDYLALFEVS